MGSKFLVVVHVLMDLECFPKVRVDENVNQKWRQLGDRLAQALPIPIQEGTQGPRTYLMSSSPMHFPGELQNLSTLGSLAHIPHLLRKLYVRGGPGLKKRALVMMVSPPRLASSVGLPMSCHFVIKRVE